MYGLEFALGFLPGALISTSEAFVMSSGDRPTMSSEAVPEMLTKATVISNPFITLNPDASSSL